MRGQYTTLLLHRVHVCSRLVCSVYTLASSAREGSDFASLTLRCRCRCGSGPGPEKKGTGAAERFPRGPAVVWLWSWSLTSSVQYGRRRQSHTVPIQYSAVSSTSLLCCSDLLRFAACRQITPIQSPARPTPPLLLLSVTAPPPSAARNKHTLDARSSSAVVQALDAVAAAAAPSLREGEGGNGPVGPPHQNSHTLPPSRT